MSDREFPGHPDLEAEEGDILEEADGTRWMRTAAGTWRHMEVSCPHAKGSLHDASPSEVRDLRKAGVAGVLTACGFSRNPEDLH